MFIKVEILSIIPYVAKENQTDEISEKILRELLNTDDISRARKVYLPPRGDVLRVSLRSRNNAEIDIIKINDLQIKNWSMDGLQELLNGNT